jgi:membrane-bound metal-dependent hydrolase YbcI (DUF457 family)
VPFTPAHAAAALPFRRWRLILSALVVGTFAPDFEYFLKFGPRGPFGHTLRGAFLFSLPAGLVFLWFFHRFVKQPVAALMPRCVEIRLTPYLGRFRFFGPSRLAMICLSVLLGIATHILWDSLTHQRMWLYHHWAFLRQKTSVPVVGVVENSTLLQYLSTIFGFVVLAVWFLQWYRAATVQDKLPYRRISPAGKVAILTLIFAVATIAGLWRGHAVIGIPHSLHTLEIFAAEGVVTLIALLWWQVVLLGLILAKRYSALLRSGKEA